MWSQKIADWIGSHRRAFEFFAQYLVCENLKSAVRKAHRYDPDINPICQDFATHYELAVVPTRAGQPRDKSLGVHSVDGMSHSGDIGIYIVQTLDYVTNACASISTNSLASIRRATSTIVQAG